ncbi:MAG: DEAD/DEAH box helicase family protein [Prevotellaceae bacterium]|jgi:type III restriction enzyme|nr:DEAD/DEAH box helicase family protein [Prevotellaceae bacterium]
MRDTLFPFQENAVIELHQKINNAHALWNENNPQIISFSAPTGSGKTIILTTLIEEIVFGSTENDAENDAVFVWLSDMPELNEQSRLKIEGKSDKLFVRCLETIDAYFDQEYFSGGMVYFLNTQKLGSEKLLTQHSDSRQFTIWETLTNIARKSPHRFYVIIDEAHRGTWTNQRAEKTAQSIMQKFIFGSKEDELCVMPLVIGVTATPQRFQNLISGTSSTIQNVKVSPEDVRDSGLLKDRIIIHYPEIEINADMTMFQNAVDDWRKKCKTWAAYCEDSGEKRTVKPVLVVQVADGNDTAVTKTDVADCLRILEKTFNRPLLPGEVVHTFNDKGNVSFGNYVMRSVEPSRIEEDEKINVVFFKMNLSTGWDCPRAETIMSFRSARDYTYIAQLLGRMIRTPLARRIASSAYLNNVSLFLPYFNEETVLNVVKALQEGEASIPAETGTGRQMVTMERNRDLADIFTAAAPLITYRVDKARKLPPLKRYYSLSRALTLDDIDTNTWKIAKNTIFKKIESELEKMKSNGSYDEAVNSITGFGLKSLIFDYSGNAYTFDKTKNILSVSEFDIEGTFNRADRILGDGLGKDYWVRHGDRDHIEVKTEVIIFVNNEKAMQKLGGFAEGEFAEIFDKYSDEIYKLPEARQDYYNKLVETSDTPIPVPWLLPLSIDASLSSNDKPYKNHLYLLEDGSFKSSLNTWEEGVLKEELENGAMAWLRNLPRKKWALQIPYQVNGVTTPMFPDLMVVNKAGKDYRFSILEPHDPSLKDNCDKARGLALFAEKHKNVYSRIELIRKQKGKDGKEHFYRLDMGKVKIRNLVRSVSSNAELDRIFDNEAVTLV